MMKPEPTPLEVREIRSAADPAWAGWLGIYHDSFPENERLTYGYFDELFARKAAGGGGEAHVLALGSGEPVGMAFYETDPELSAGFLWYLATRGEARGQGLGAGLYAEIVRRCREAGMRLLLFEVELPDEDDAGGFARRRIEWYRRQGARLLDGVQYFQSVDRPLPPVEMRLMVHPLQAVGAEQAFAVAAQVFGDAVSQTGPLTLT